MDLVGLQHDQHGVRWPVARTQDAPATIPFNPRAARWSAANSCWRSPSKK
jgi:hypothetical protein